MRSERNKFMLSDNAYNVIRGLVQVVLPASAALYFGLAGIWGFPSAEEIVGTIAVFTTFLGALLRLSAKEYEKSGAWYDGEFVTMPSADGNGLVYSLDFQGGNLEDLADKKAITFKAKAVENNAFDGA